VNDAFHSTGRRQSKLQPWVATLTLMQQGVLMTAMRGPDGLPKNHISKVLLRWYRRCILIHAFDKKVYCYSVGDVMKPSGGSFMGPLKQNHAQPVYHAGPGHTPVRRRPEELLEAVVDEYLGTVDEIPHHFQLHFMHAAEILGYKHPVSEVRFWWYDFYRRLVNDMHLHPETEEQMDFRLADNEQQWLEAEEVTAR
jgi:hypothetical protein